MSGPFSAEPVAWPDGEYTCRCVEGTCTPVDEVPDDSKVARGGKRFNGHWEATKEGLRFVIDRTWLDSK